MLVLLNTAQRFDVEKHRHFFTKLAEEQMVVKKMHIAYKWLRLSQHLFSLTFLYQRDNNLTSNTKSAW